ncbi:MAG: carbohydrate binding family 9 domain-containing protein [Candidatus Krumholzibacteriota bacterium]|nr:carbohydrate binding family 9 domain-containing protein [Candidatus Krumholzibacteriota bacterium]
MTIPLGRLAALCLTLVIAAVPAFAGQPPESERSTSEFSPNTNLVFTVPRGNQEVRIDGNLDEEMWRGAARLDNFTEIDPGDNVKPAVETETYFVYDDENLYVGFVCYDDAPGEIRATITDRDNIFQDDYIGILIDTFKDEQNAYEFFVNPYGIQGDLRRSRNDEDASYNAVWSSQGRITDYGWTAEIAIPFRSIRFPDAAIQDWGLHVIRNRPRDSREQYSWAPISRDEACMFCVAGTMSGLEGVNQGRNLEILPYALAGQSSGLEDVEDGTSPWDDGRADGQAGASLKYGITSNYTLDATYNPDFSQIESDVTQIDANETFALFFPERRPFFLEGADIFDSKINAVYTRSINDPLTAGKVTGKSNATTVGMMSALDRTSPYIVPFSEQSEFAEGGKTWSNIFRVKKDVLSESFVGALLTDRRNVESSGGSNTTLSGDARIRFWGNYALEAHILGSRTVEPNDTTLTEDWEDVRFGEDRRYTSAFDGETYNGHAMEVSVNRSARHYDFWVWYEDYSPTFRAENGFIRRNNFRTAGLWNGYMFHIDDHPVLERVQPQLSMGRWFNYQGQRIDEWAEPAIWVRFKKQTWIWTSYVLSNERFSGEWVEGIRRWQGNIDTQFSPLISGGLSWRYGQSLVRDEDDPRLGNEQTISTWINLKPTSQLQANLSYNSFKLSEIDTGAEIDDAWVARLRLTYQFTPRLFVRAIGEYIDWDNTITLDPLLSYKINPFTVFFVGSSHAFHDFRDDPAALVDERGYRQTSRVFFVKFQYLFRM